MLVCGGLLHRHDIGFLASGNIEASLRDLGFSLKAAGLAKASVEFALQPIEQRLEPVEVLACLAMGDLLGGALVRGRSDVPEFGDAGRSCLHPELRQKLVVVDLVRVANGVWFRVR